MKIIAFTGMPFSGKSEAVKIAIEKNIPVVRMGDMVWRETKERGMKLTGDNVGFVANEMRNKHGKQIWAEKTIQEIQKNVDTEKIVVDGVRNKEEVKVFKEKIGEDFLLIAITASDETRYKRAMKRGRKDDIKDIDKIKERDKREKNWGIQKVIDSADIIIDNDKDLETFRKKILNVLNK
jgi:dephospho-CoA kinase